MLFTFSVLSFRYSTEELFSDRREALAGLGLCLSGPLLPLVYLVMELSSGAPPRHLSWCCWQAALCSQPYSGKLYCKELPHPRSLPSWGGHTQQVIGMVQFGLVLDGHPSSVPLWRWSGLALVCMWLLFSPPYPASFSILLQVFLSRALLTSHEPCLGLSFPKNPSCSIFSL